MAVFSDAYSQHRDKLVKDALLVVEGQVSHDDFSGGLKMRADDVCWLEDARQNRLSAIRLRWQPSLLPQEACRELKQVLQPFVPGSCRLVVDYQLPGVQADVHLGEGWCVKPSDELLIQLRSAYGAESVSLVYRA